MFTTSCWFLCAHVASAECVCVPLRVPGDRMEERERERRADPTQQQEEVFIMEMDLQHQEMDFVLGKKESRRERQANNQIKCVPVLLEGGCCVLRVVYKTARDDNTVALPSDEMAPTHSSFFSPLIMCTGLLMTARCCRCCTERGNAQVKTHIAFNWQFRLRQRQIRALATAATTTTKESMLSVYYLLPSPGGRRGKIVLSGRVCVAGCCSFSRATKA